jgi:hypothetical protein
MKGAADLANYFSALSSSIAYLAAKEHPYIM